MPAFAPAFEPTQPQTVTVIVPAYNEATRIWTVLDTICAVRSVTQILVIDDASEDATAAVVGQYAQIDSRVCLLRHSVNRGKATAMLVGAMASTNDVLTFVDADLVGLRSQNLVDLITPVQTGVSAMTLGVFTQGRRQTAHAQRLMPFLSGQRCLRWHLFRTTPGLYMAGWGLEVALSLYAWHQHYPVALVQWPGVTHITRRKKMTKLQGHLASWDRWLAIAQYLSGQLYTKRSKQYG